MKHKSIVVTEADAGKRLDVIIAQYLSPELSRTKVKSCIQNECVTLNGIPTVTPHHRVEDGDSITITYDIFVPSPLVPVTMPLDIRFEDDYLMIINKPAGIVVHPGAGTTANTLAHGLAGYAQRLSSAGGAERPGIVHRIDKDTSGLLVVAKNDMVHRLLAEQFRLHSITRRYYVVVKGVVQHDEGKCDAPIGRGVLFKKKVIVGSSEGRHAVTYFKVVERFPTASLLDIRLETGRTHQIRVHMAYVEHPVIGDAVYGVSSPHISRQALHAYRLGFMHPVLKTEIDCTSELPSDVAKLLAILRDH